MKLKNVFDSTGFFLMGFEKKMKSSKVSDFYKRFLYTERKVVLRSLFRGATVDMQMDKINTLVSVIIWLS